MRKATWSVKSHDNSCVWLPSSSDINYNHMKSRHCRCSLDGGEAHEKEEERVSAASMLATNVSIMNALKIKKIRAL